MFNKNVLGQKKSCSKMNFCLHGTLEAAIREMFVLHNLFKLIRIDHHALGSDKVQTLII